MKIFFKSFFAMFAFLMSVILGFAGLVWGMVLLVKHDLMWLLPVIVAFGVSLAYAVMEVSVFQKIDKK